MKKRLVLQGEFCDICGGEIDPYLNEQIYDEGNIYYACKKRLKASLMSPFSERKNREYAYNNIAPHDMILCGRCAYRFCKMFTEWKSTCEAEGEETRERRRLMLEGKRGR